MRGYLLVSTGLLAVLAVATAAAQSPGPPKSDIFGMDGGTFDPRAPMAAEHARCAGFMSMYGGLLKAQNKKSATEESARTEQMVARDQDSHIGHVLSFKEQIGSADAEKIGFERHIRAAFKSGEGLFLAAGADKNSRVAVTEKFIYFCATLPAPDKFKY